MENQAMLYYLPLAIFSTPNLSVKKTPGKSKPGSKKSPVKATLPLKSATKPQQKENNENIPDRNMQSKQFFYLY